MGAYPNPGDAFGRYLVGRRIGRGGMGSVFEAVQPELDRSVALKVLSAELSEEPDFRLRFGREATMLAALDSPHVIQVYESGDHDGSLYIATQLVKGRDLARLVDASGGLAPARALDIVAQSASGLADAHAVGLLHRDVKPSNILVRESRDEPFAYLCDFGIARPAEGGHTRTAEVMGTIAYMAPERTEGAPATFASDIYALGCVLWAALTGQDPYGGTSYIQIALAHVHEPVPQLPGGSPVEDAVNAILRHSMAKAPEDRFASAGEMRAALVAAHGLARAERPRPQDPIDNSTVTGGAVPPPPPAGGGRDGTAGERPPMTVVAADSARGRWPRPALAAAAVLVLAVITLTAVLMANGREGTPSRTAADRSTAPGSASSSPKARPVTCWDDSAAASAARCPVPQGRSGMATVFQPLDGQCREPTSLAADGKAEVFLCAFEGTDYVIRYSRWGAGADRSAYYDESNPGARVSAWLIDGERVGTMWTSVEEGTPTPYQRSATYDDQPFSVSVEGSTSRARSDGWQRIRAEPPSRIGLR